MVAQRSLSSQPQRRQPATALPGSRPVCGVTPAPGARQRVPRRPTARTPGTGDGSRRPAICGATSSGIGCRLRRGSASTTARWQHEPRPSSASSQPASGPTEGNGQGPFHRRTSNAWPQVVRCGPRSTSYTRHLMGLLDQFRIAGNEQALEVASAFAGWFETWTSGLSRQQLDDILDRETGGMLEVWADLLAFTGDDLAADLIQRYDRPPVLRATTRRCRCADQQARQHTDRGDPGRGHGRGRSLENRGGATSSKPSGTPLWTHAERTAPAAVAAVRCGSRPENSPHVCTRSRSTASCTT